jgi:hypothetical protein
VVPWRASILVPRGPAEAGALGTPEGLVVGPVGDESEEMLDGGDVLPGFKCKVGEIFG